MTQSDNYSELCEQADAVRTPADLAKLIYAVIEDGTKTPQPRYWQWQVDHLFLESIGAQIEGEVNRRDGVHLESTEDAFRYIANAIVLAIIME